MVKTPPGKRCASLRKVEMHMDIRISHKSGRFYAIIYSQKRLGTREPTLI